jgi:hypothetical protein
VVLVTEFDRVLLRLLGVRGMFTQRNRIKMSNFKIDANKEI